MKDAAFQLSRPRNLPEERIATANMIAFWRKHLEGTADPFRIASYTRIINSLVQHGKSLEEVHV